MKLIECFEKHYKEWSYFAIMENAQFGGTTPVNRLRFAYEVASNTYFWGSLACRYLGHRIACESDITPEHGIEYFECSRCGWSHEHVYF